ncbi:NAD-dependent epimerase/dehydratase family protein [Fodinicola feengrottensis]|uniref:NAD-dependent epimerase/dehydratase family protein n=1 Tax=Fodinicola feengrottensis TaxID=435914 RepID=UPI0013D5BC53|nr:NAD-dependent epimerase/dehydratase family protein [Fodinicola feengrottensis]
MGSVLITGANGMLGRRLTAQVLEAGTLAGPDGKQTVVDAVVAADVAEPPVKLSDARLTYRVGDISDPDFVSDIVDSEVTSVFHLAGVVSGAAERDFDLGQRVNVDGMTYLLEILRSLGTAPRFVFTSSLAVYGGDLPARLTDGQRLTPQTSYGMQKAMGEFLVAEYTPPRLGSTAVRYGCRPSRSGPARPTRRRAASFPRSYGSRWLAVRTPALSMKLCGRPFFRQAGAWKTCCGHTSCQLMPGVGTGR